MLVKPIPENYSRLSPYLAIKNAGAAIEFYKQIFGATERMRMPGPGGSVGHAELQFGDTVLMLADECPDMSFKGPQAYGGSSVMLHLYVENVDKVFEAAVQAGAKVTRPVQDQFYGDRSGSLIDPFGHWWNLSTHIEDLSMEELTRRSEEAKKQMSSAKQ
jgi:PhnB protein